LGFFASQTVLEELFELLYPKLSGRAWHILTTPQVPVVNHRGEVVGGCDILAEGFPDTLADESADEPMVRLTLYLMTEVRVIGSVLRELNNHALYEEHLLPYIAVLVVAGPCPHRQVVRQSHIALVEYDPDEGWLLWYDLVIGDEPISLPLGPWPPRQGSGNSRT
jgi:hypothetical protein